MYNSSSVYAVNYQARAMCSQRGSTEGHRFIVGTCSLHDANELSVLQYSEDSNHIECANVYNHPDQIWAVEASPKDPTLVVTSRQASIGSKSLTMWKMPHENLDSAGENDMDDSIRFSQESLELDSIATFNHNEKPSIVTCVKWHSLDDTLLTMDGNLLSNWSIGDGKISQLNGTMVGESGNPRKLPDGSAGSACWDPHSSAGCAAVYGSTLQIIDTRDMDVSITKKGAHDGIIRDVDYNSNKPLMLVTAGDDRKVRFWDLRSMHKPVKTLAGHSHWVLSAKYNPYHDQLILSGGSDNAVNLWRIASCSSAPWLGSGEGEGGGGGYSAASGETDSSDPPDVKIRLLDQHEESVYSVAWSPADAWIYCSLSLDGRVIVNHVPSTEKYKILL